MIVISIFTIISNCSSSFSFLPLTKVRRSLEVYGPWVSHQMIPLIPLSPPRLAPFITQVRFPNYSYILQQKDKWVFHRYDVQPYSPVTPSYGDLHCLQDYLIHIHALAWNGVPGHTWQRYERVIRGHISKHWQDNGYQKTLSTRRLL